MQRIPIRHQPIKYRSIKNWPTKDRMFLHLRENPSAYRTARLLMGNWIQQNEIRSWRQACR